jgi:hypothetical protein
MTDIYVYKFKERLFSLYSINVNTQYLQKTQTSINNLKVFFNEYKNTDIIKDQMPPLVFESKLHLENYNSDLCFAYKTNKYTQCNKQKNKNSMYCTTCNKQALINKFKVPNYGRVDIRRAKYNFKTNKVIKNICDWKGDASFEDNNIQNNKLQVNVNENITKNAQEQEQEQEQEHEEPEPVVCVTESLSLINDTEVITSEIDDVGDEGLSDDNGSIEESDDPWRLTKIIYQGEIYWLHGNNKIHNKRNLGHIGTMENGSIKFKNNYSIIHEAYIIDEYQTNIIYVNN